MPPTLVHVEGDVFAGGLQVGDVRRAAHDLHHVVHGEADAGLVRHRRQVQARRWWNRRWRRPPSRRSPARGG